MQAYLLVVYRGGVIVFHTVAVHGVQIFFQLRPASVLIPIMLFTNLLKVHRCCYNLMTMMWKIVKVSAGKAQQAVKETNKYSKKELKVNAITTVV